MSQLEAFRNDVEAFLRLGVVSATQLGKEALGDPSFIPDLRAGRAPSLATVDKVLAFIRSKTPRATKRAAA